MTYGGTRNWALWIITDSGMAKVLYGQGFLYKDEAAAKRGLDRLIRSGEVVIIDGEPHGIRIGRYRRVTIEKVRAE